MSVSCYRSAVAGLPAVRHGRGDRDLHHRRHVLHPRQLPGLPGRRKVESGQTLAIHQRNRTDDLLALQLPVGHAQLSLPGRRLYHHPADFRSSGVHEVRMLNVRFVVFRLW